MCGHSVLQLIDFFLPEPLEMHTHKTSNMSLTFIGGVCDVCPLLQEHYFFFFLH